MQDAKVNCNKCDVLILTSTFNKSGGFCMPCFMKLNDGLRPSELNALKDRGLFEFFIRWNAFVKKGGASVKGNGRIIDKLSHWLPVINASISGYLRCGKGKFDGQKNSDYLVKLKAASEGDILLFLTEIERFNSELVKATKTL